MPKYLSEVPKIEHIKDVSKRMKKAQTWTDKVIEMIDADARKTMGLKHRDYNKHQRERLEEIVNPVKQVVEEYFEAVDRVEL